MVSPCAKQRRGAQLALNKLMQTMESLVTNRQVLRGVIYPAF